MSLYDRMVSDLFNSKDKKDYSHLIITIDNSDMEYVKTFVKRDEKIKDVLFDIVSNPTYEIKEIYNYDMDFEKQLKEKRTYHINPVYNKMNEAYNFAYKIHKNQTRKDGSPYINHPVKVAELVHAYLGNHPRVNELITAAYLHDTVEDVEQSKREDTITEIENKFGNYVLSLVLGLTNNDELKHKMGKATYLCYKMSQMSEDELSLKLCDRLANTLDLDNAPDKFVEKYEVETIVIMNYLVNNVALNSIQRQLITDINSYINNLRKPMIMKLAYKYNN